jgi:hypothetical protein
MNALAGVLTMINVYLENGLWHAFYTNINQERLGPEIINQDRDKAIFLLGKRMGEKPQEFSRPMGELV